jgi:hypothetical protein
MASFTDATLFAAATRCCLLLLSFAAAAATPCCCHPLLLPPHSLLLPLACPELPLVLPSVIPCCHKVHELGTKLRRLVVLRSIDKAFDEKKTEVHHALVERIQGWKV